MTNAEMIEELRNLIKYAKSQHTGVARNINKSLGNSRKNIKIYLNIKGLYYFAGTHREISNGAIKYFVQKNQNRFKVLADFVKNTENPIGILRTQGYKDTTISYIKTLELKEKEEQTIEK